MPEAAVPKPAADGMRAQRDERIAMIRLGVLNGQEHDARGTTTPVAIGGALGTAPGEALGLLRRKLRRDGELEVLRAMAARLAPLS